MTFLTNKEIWEMRAHYKAEIERLRNIVRDCLKKMRELDVGGHQEQSWPDFCADTERLIIKGTKL